MNRRAGVGGLDVHRGRRRIQLHAGELPGGFQQRGLQVVVFEKQAKAIQTQFIGMKSQPPTAADIPGHDLVKGRQTIRLQTREGTDLFQVGQGAPIQRGHPQTGRLLGMGHDRRAGFQDPDWNTTAAQIHRQCGSDHAPANDQNARAVHRNLLDDWKWCHRYRPSCCPG